MNYQNKISSYHLSVLDEKFIKGIRLSPYQSFVSLGNRSIISFDKSKSLFP